VEATKDPLNEKSETIIDMNPKFLTSAVAERNFMYPESFPSANAVLQ